MSDVKVKLEGEKFGRWIVLNFSHLDKNKRQIYNCQCECGTIKLVPAIYLKNGQSKSCGCYKLDLFKQRVTTHGKTESRIYKTWTDMKARCNNVKNKRYKQYGGRGIKVCEEWENDFEKFCEWAYSNGYSDDLTIERIDFNDNYSPENCKFITMSEQAKNRSYNRNITIDGVTKNMSEWSREYNVNYSTLVSRIKDSKLTGIDILQPVKKGGNK